MSAQAFQYNKDYRRCELCYEYWPKVPSIYFPDGRRECLNCHPGDEIQYYYTVCGKCGKAWWCKHNLTPWLCYSCQHPEIKEPEAKVQMEYYQRRKEYAIANLPVYIKPDLPNYEELRWEYKKFHKSGKTVEKERKEAYRKMQMRMATATRYARLHGAPTNYTWELWMQKATFYGWKCVYCSTELTIKSRQKNTLTCDHFKALKNGGTHYLSNLFPACRSCNSRKGAKKGWEIKFRVPVPIYPSVPK